MPLPIRPLNPTTDLPTIATLFTQLGYPLTPTQLQQRLLTLDPTKNETLVAVNNSDLPLGFLHLRINDSLLVDPRLEVVALIVDEAARSQGIGKLLMEHAEFIARSKGLADIIVWSNITRADAHRFYQSLGYDHKKTNHLFTKRLD
ncbi:GNAT family N-acetyltransferase [Lacunimicrobium album]